MNINLELNSGEVDILENIVSSFSYELSKGRASEDEKRVIGMIENAIREARGKE